MERYYMFAKGSKLKLDDIYFIQGLGNEKWWESVDEGGEDIIITRNVTIRINVEYLDEQKEPDHCPECGSDNPLIRKCPSCRGYTEGGGCVPCQNAWHGQNDDKKHPVNLCYHHSIAKEG